MCPYTHKLVISILVNFHSFKPIFRQEYSMEMCLFTRIAKAGDCFPQTDKSFLCPVESNQICIVVTIFRLIWNQTDFRWVHNQRENCHFEGWSFYFVFLWRFSCFFFLFKGFFSWRFFLFKSKQFIFITYSLTRNKIVFLSYQAMENILLWFEKKKSSTYITVSSLC